MATSLLPTFVGASQPDIVLAKQKDAHYQNKVTENFLEAADSLLGAHAALILRPELELLSESIYNGTTTLIGKQTPGEEYCDLLQVTETEVGTDDQNDTPHETAPDAEELSRRVVQIIQRLAPIRSHRVPYVLLSVLIPYFTRRWKAGGWKPLGSVFSQQTAHQRAAAFREQLRQRQLATARKAATKDGDENGSSKQDGRNEDQSFTDLIYAYMQTILESVRKVVNTVVARLPNLAITVALASTLNRFHLATFYLNGTYFDWASRFTGMRYVFTKEPEMGRPSYRILGYFLMLQISVQVGGIAYRNALALRCACRSLIDRFTVGSVEQAELPSENRSVEAVIVPSKTSIVDAEESEPPVGLAGRCGICLSGMTNPACPPCGHVYCYECIMESVLSKPECPACRQHALPSNVACMYFQFR